MRIGGYVQNGKRYAEIEVANEVEIEAIKPWIKKHNAKRVTAKNIPAGHVDACAERGDFGARGDWDLYEKGVERRFANAQSTIRYRAENSNGKALRDARWLARRLRS